MTPAARRPRLVHVTTTDISLELLLGPQLEAFQAAGYEVIGASAPGPHLAALAARGIRHEPVHRLTRAMAPWRDAQAVVELVRLFRRLRPDVVHTHNPKPGVYGRLAARLAGVPVVVNTVHGLYAQPTDRWAKRALVYGLERLAATCSDAELLQNEEDLPVLRSLHIPADRLHVLGNGIDLARFDPDALDPDDLAAARAELGATGPDDVVVGLVGRLVREKGYLEVFAAAEELARTHPSVRVAVIGPDEPDKADGIDAEQRARAEEVGVRFLGMREDVPRLYAAMDVHVLASHREGFPRSPMEAAAMGVPVVATDIRGCRQAVAHGVTGLLVPVGDAAALARAVGELADDPARRAAMGAAGREKAVREFDQQRIIDTTLATYARLRGVPPVVDGPRPATVADAPAVAALHASRIPEGFLVSLGPAFLRRLYRRMVRSDAAFVLVLDDPAVPGGLAGFVAVAESTGRLYRDFLLHDGLRAGLAALPAIARAPRHVWETLRYGMAGDDAPALPPAEVLSIAVAAEAAGQGAGGRLLAAAVAELERREIRGAHVVTAVGNEPAIRMYERGGFRRERRIEVHAGVAQEVLVWG